MTMNYFEIFQQGYDKANNEWRERMNKLRAELHATAEMHEDGDYYLRDEWIDEYFDDFIIGIDN